MSVYAAIWHGVNARNEPIKGTIQELGNYAGCFGVFQHPPHTQLTDESAKYTMLMKAAQGPGVNEERHVKATMEFMESPFFRRLTGNSVLAVARARDEWEGRNIRAQMGRYTNHGEEIMLEVTFNAHYNADRLITAFRMATQAWKAGDDIRNIAEDDLKYVPLAASLIGGNGVEASDGYVSFAGITKAQAEEYKQSRGEDDWGDVYYDDFASWAFNGNSMTQAGVIEILQRTEADYKARERTINMSLLRNGYIKDDELDQDDLDRLEDDMVLSIGSPVSHNFTEPGPLMTNNLQQLVAFLKQHDIK